MDLSKNLSPELKAEIDGLTQVQMAHRWRFAPTGDPVFVGDAGKYFNERFTELGGMTTKVSKQIGWER